tara:strand:- start:214 stop:462 length:249 start_codon:yes stop_codon:yes gene_type:complete
MDRNSKTCYLSSDESGLWPVFRAQVSDFIEFIRGSRFFNGTTPPLLEWLLSWRISPEPSNGPSLLPADFRLPPPYKLALNIM